jgi:hypothetical protein
LSNAPIVRRMKVANNKTKTVTPGRAGNGPLPSRVDR